MNKLVLFLFLFATAVFSQTINGVPNQTLPSGSTSVPGVLQCGSGVVCSGGVLQVQSQSGTQYTGAQVISGCGVQYVSGLTYEVGACTYSLNNVTYNSPLSSITLPAADPSNPEIDVIFVDTTQAVQYIQGTPASNPQEPTTTPTTQLALTFVLVPASSSTPANTTVTNIYQEGSEWSYSAGTNVSPLSTNFPFRGTYDVEFGSGGAATTASTIFFHDPSSGTVNLSTYNNLIFYVRNKAAWPAACSVQVQWYNLSFGTVGNSIVLNNNAFGLNTSSNFSTYQQISVPVNSFNTGSNLVATLGFLVEGTGCSMTGFYLDDVTIQGGVNSVPPSSLNMNWKGSWNSTASYNPNDTVVSGNVGYVALVSNTNVAVTNASTWAPLAVPLSLTTTGTTGAATLSSGVLNIPQYQGAITLTTTGTSGPSTLTGNTLNVPQYSGGGSGVQYSTTTRHVILGDSLWVVGSHTSTQQDTITSIACVSGTCTGTVATSSDSWYTVGNIIQFDGSSGLSCLNWSRVTLGTVSGSTITFPESGTTCSGNVSVSTAIAANHDTFQDDPASGFACDGTHCTWTAQTPTNPWYVVGNRVQFTGNIAGYTLWTPGCINFSEAIITNVSGSTIQINEADTNIPTRAGCTGVVSSTGGPYIVYNAENLAPSQAVRLSYFTNGGTITPQLYNRAWPGDALNEIATNIAAKIGDLNPDVTGIPAELWFMTDDQCGEPNYAAFQSDFLTIIAYAKAHHYTVNALTIPNGQIGCGLFGGGTPIDWFTANQWINSLQCSNAGNSNPVPCADRVIDTWSMGLNNWIDPYTVQQGGNFNGHLTTTGAGMFASIMNMARVAKARPRAQGTPGLGANIFEGEQTIRATSNGSGQPPLAAWYSQGSNSQVTLNQYGDNIWMSGQNQTASNPTAPTFYFAYDTSGGVQHILFPIGTAGFGFTNSGKYCQSCFSLDSTPDPVTHQYDTIDVDVSDGAGSGAYNNSLAAMQFRTLKLKTYTADPNSPSNGWLWYNSTTNQIRAFVNGGVVCIAGSGCENSGTVKFTTTGCSVSSTTGGGTDGIFTLGANSCTVVITLNGATGLTAPNGWTCSAHDRTAPTVLIGGESSSTTTTASITIPAGAGTTDVISFSCTPF